MNRFSFALRAFLAGGLLSVPLLAGYGRSDPVSAAREFYERHYDFYQLANPAQVKDVVTPEFYDLLKRVQKGVQAETFVIEVDFWTCAQDGQIVDPVAFGLLGITRTTAVVQMKYDFECSGVEKKSVLMTFERRPGISRWLLADLMGPAGSFIDFHEAWYAEEEANIVAPPTDPGAGNRGD